MQPPSSWDRSHNGQGTLYNQIRGHAERVTEPHSIIATSRSILFRTIPQHDAEPNAVTNQRDDLNNLALALAGVTLRPQPRVRSPIQLTSVRTDSKSSESLIFLADLPVELLMMFLDYLDWESLTTLRFTSKFFAQLVLSANLQAHYRRCHDETAREEQRLLEQDSNRVTWISMYGESTQARALIGDMKRLPCYRCLRWFRCRPSTKLSESRKSVFSDCMAQSRDQQGVSRHITRSRLCFDCGVRSGYYHKGGQFKRYVICILCGKLGGDLTRNNLPFQPNDGPQKNAVGLRNRYYCLSCIELEKCPSSYAEHEHRYGRKYKYERAMWKKRERCIAKRKELGRAEPDESNRWEMWCPILKRKSICSCWKNESRHRSHFDYYVW